MQASCQCGAVKFTTPTATPLEIYICHCLECQRQSGSAFGTSAMFPAFSLPPDAPITRWDRITDTGKHAKCYFCKICGTRLMHDRGTGTVSVKGGCLDGLDWRQAKHIWTKRAVVPIPKDAEQWEGEPDE